MRPHHPASRQNSPSLGTPSRLSRRQNEPRPSPPPFPICRQMRAMDENADTCSTNLLHAVAPASVADPDHKCVHRPHAAPLCARPFKRTVRHAAPPVCASRQTRRYVTPPSCVA
eukprot:5853776-Prymnesium_polylepis.1